MIFKHLSSERKVNILQIILFLIIGFCLVVFLYGIANFPDAPYKFCVNGPYCGKTGKYHSFETYSNWKQWEKIFFSCLPFGIFSGFGVKYLVKIKSRL